MVNQLKAEFYKLRKCSFLYLVFLLMISLGVLYGYFRIIPQNIKADEIFSNSISDTSLIFIVAVFALYYLAGDFSNRTIHNEIKMGYSRISAMISRGIVLFPFVFLLHISFPITVSVIAGIFNGFENINFSTNLLIPILVVSVQLMAIFSFLILITFVTQKVISAFAFGISFIFITCNIIRNFDYPETLQKLYEMSCFNLFNLSSTVNPVYAILFSLTTLTLVYFIGYLIIKKRDII